MTARRDCHDEPPTRPDEGFLGRWLRLKRSAGRPGNPPQEHRPDSPAAVAVTEWSGPRPARPVQQSRLPGGIPPAVEEPRRSSARSALEERPELPPLATLGTQSDFRPFLAPEVDPDLRRQALRRLFHLPQFNVRDADTDDWEDYTRFEPLGDLIPHEMRTALAREARRLAEAALDASGGGAVPSVPPETRAAEQGEPAARDAVPRQIAGAGRPERIVGAVGDSSDVAGSPDPAFAGRGET